MPAFLRGLLLFVVGATVGAVAVLVFAPGFSVVVSRAAPAVKAVEVAAVPVPAPAVPPVVVKAAEPAVATKPAVAVSAPAAPAQAPAPSSDLASEPAIDFKAVSEHLILWPNTVTVKSATAVPVIVDGKKVQDLALEAGATLQVSKVLADGSLEARAKGAKFEIKSSLTDFSVELGKRVAELVAKGTKLEPLGLSAAAAPAPAAMSAPPVAVVTPTTPAPAPTVVVASAPKGPLTLAQRVDILFGNNKPDVSTPVPAPASASAPVAPAPATSAATPAPAVPMASPVAAPAAEAAPSANADPKTAEKGKDLDRKMNQLFK